MFDSRATATEFLDRPDCGPALATATCIGFEMRQGKLRHLLHPSVPALAAAAVGQLLTGERTRPGCRPISRIIAHVGGRDVLDAIAQTCADCDLAASRQVLRECGNMSSPSVLFALERALHDESPDEKGDWWLTSFGAGFSAQGCRLELRRVVLVFPASN